LVVRKVTPLRIHPLALIRQFKTSGASDGTVRRRCEPLALGDDAAAARLRRVSPIGFDVAIILCSVDPEMECRAIDMGDGFGDWDSFDDQSLLMRVPWREGGRVSERQRGGREIRERDRGSEGGRDREKIGTQQREDEREGER
jgi:hypothetical protein